ncbi:MAG TPA: SgcJ/EcaC family oxidoreductase [Candidatus Acidoferrum sp.]|nr:SgcJ/EcaC family oxidoreductase [Candidatus Acidoferrum sp.]
MNNKRVWLLIALAIVCPNIKGTGEGLSAGDIEKIKQVHKKYEEAWLREDDNGVRALFTEDCVLLPPHGDKARIGQKGLNEYWFPPDAPATKITKLVVTPESIGGDGQLAYAWGTDEVAWTTVKDGKATSASHKGIFLNVLQKQADGEWKLLHHMWDDAVDRR